MKRYHIHMETIEKFVPHLFRYFSKDIYSQFKNEKKNNFLLGMYGCLCFKNYGFPPTAANFKHRLFNIMAYLPQLAALFLDESILAIISVVCYKRDSKQHA